ncbi:exosortase Y-associated Wzy-like protein [Salinibacter ruber]|uniref:exosortase Y-associated Wzy-like protein n=1 Tax=Salinibacter ruber TaxID=146919 RepID=UPI0021699E4F|nr:hypothetical protein [Salinibacter ruber]MCS4136375.1 hypothetical protein [Salinibacter ruber]
MALLAPSYSSRLRPEPAELAYLLLYLPWGLAHLLYQAPVLSYGIAWAGSVFIFAVSVMGLIRPLPGDRPVHRQLFRPLFLMQGFFAGYFCLTSIFYVWKLMSEGGSTPGELQRVAAAQRYYVLGHAAFVTGLLSVMDYRSSGRWQFRTSLSRAQLALSLAVGALLLALILDQLPGLGQFVGKLRALAPVATILSFALALRDGELKTGFVGFTLYGYILFRAFLTGWKESIMVALALFVLYLYPGYRRTALFLGAIGLIVSITIVPAYNETYRELNWKQGVAEEKAAAVALGQLTTGDVDIREEAWTFLRNRATQIGQFTQYIEHTPQREPYYGFSIIERAVVFLTPRVLWPEKPYVEKVVMQRVYRSGLTSPSSGVSMKPQNIVDGYLSGGGVGVFLTCLIMGLVATWASRMVEAWFGGYAIGTQAVYVALFFSVVRQNSFEYWLNAVFWSFVFAVIVFVSLRELGVLCRTSKSPRSAQGIYSAVAPER